MATSAASPPFSELRAIDVLAAARRLRGVARRTPLRRSPGLSAVAGGDVYLKLENEQLTGSFKVRGALNALAALSAEQKSWPESRSAARRARFRARDCRRSR